MKFLKRTRNRIKYYTGSDVEPYYAMYRSKHRTGCVYHPARPEYFTFSLTNAAARSISESGEGENFVKLTEDDIELYTGVYVLIKLENIPRMIVLLNRVEFHWNSKRTIKRLIKNLNEIHLEYQ